MNRQETSFEYGLSRKKDGNMKMSGVSCDHQIMVNRQRFLEGLKINPERLVVVESEHKNKVKLVRNFRKNVSNTCDALISDNKDLVLGVTVADCLPLYFFDKRKKLIGIAHAGWRGLLLGVIGKVVLKMRKEYGSKPGNLIAIIGPHIQANSYEVGREVADKFADFANCIIIKNKRIFLDLSMVASRLLIDQGIKPQNIKISQVDTFKNNNYFSYRRDKPKNVEAMLAYIRLL